MMSWLYGLIIVMLGVEVVVHLIVMVEYEG